MTYKQLPKEDLKNYETDFNNFLAMFKLNIHSWEELKQENPDKAEHFWSAFSAHIKENECRQIKFLDYRTPKEMKVFNLEHERMIMVGIEIPQDSEIDLTDTIDSERLLSFKKEEGIKIYKKEKVYSKKREVVIYELLENGCSEVDDKLFSELNNLVEV